MKIEEEFNYVQLKLQKDPINTEKFKDVINGPFSSPVAVYEASKKIIGENLQETVLLWGTDVRNHVVLLSIIAKGDIERSIAPINPIMKTLLLSPAKRCFLVHNHPSGFSSDETLVASEKDIAVSRHLMECCKMFEILLADSLIIGGDQFVSLRQEGLLSDDS